MAGTPDRFPPFDDADKVRRLQGRVDCPSCHAKRREEWGEWMREELLLDIPHR